MPKIIDLVNAKSERLGRLKKAPPVLSQEERDALSKEAEDLSKLATRAIIEGRFSLAWREYMLQFVDQEPFNPNQLARLLAEDGTISDEMMNRRRAYLLGNAVCGAPSTGRTDFMFAFGVDGIDDGV